MPRSHLRYRVISLVSLLVLALSVTSYLGLQSARALDLRGRSVGYPQPIFGAEQLRLGVNVALEQYDDATLDAHLADLAQRGIGTIRQEFRWSDMEPKRGQFDWVNADRIFRAAQKHRISVLPVLFTTPPWARTSSASEASPPTETAPPANVDDFAAFAGAFAKRYDRTQQIIGYQVWDEPNLSSAWGDALINPTYYLQMLRAARSAIRRVNDNARIVLAALAPTVEQSNVNLAPQTYLLKLYQLGGHEAFDIAAAKPYGFDNPPDDRRIDPSVLNFSHMILLREVMEAHGDGYKAIWATSFGWNALPGQWEGEKSMWGNVGGSLQAAYTRQAVQRAASEWPWLGGMFIENLQPRPRAKDPLADARWGFSLLAQDGAPRPVFDALTQAMPEAANAPRAQLFAACASAQSLARTLRLDNVLTAMPEVLSAKPDCRLPNPQAQFTDGWRFDQLGADIPDRPDAKVTIRFSGQSLALIVRRGPYRAYTFVRVDGAPANALPHEERGAYLIMTSPGLYPVIETVEVARDLPPGEHTAEITVDRGWNQWALIGWSPAMDWGSRWFALGGWLAIAVGVLSALALVWSLPQARWPQAVASAISTLRGQTLDANVLTPAAIAAALLYWMSASITWAQDAATAWRNLGLLPNVVLPSVAAAVAFWSPLMVLSLIALAVLFALVLLRLEIGLALLAFFIPFFLIPQRLFERSFSMVELLTVMCLVSWGARQIFGRDWRVVVRTLARAGSREPRSLLRPIYLFDVAVVGLVVVALLSSLQAQFRTEAFREWRTVVVEPALVYLMMRTSRIAPAKNGILTAFLLGAVVVALLGLVNYARGVTFAAEFGLPRIKSVYNSANNDALYLERALAIMAALAVFGARVPSVPSVPFTIAPSGWNVRKWMADPARTVAVLGLVPIGIALLLTQSRGALILGMPVALIVMAMLAGGRWRWLGIGLAVTGAAGVALIASGALMPLLDGTRFARLATAFDLQGSTGFFRVNLWQSALQMWRDHPLLGVGPDNFLYAYRSFYILPAAWQEPNLSHPHNVVLDFATRLGTLGLLMGVGLAVGYARLAARAMRTNRALAIGCIGFLAAMLAHGLVDHSFFLIDLAYAFMLTAGLMCGGDEGGEWTVDGGL